MNADTSLARLRFDRFELDEAEARLMCAGQPVALAPKPFAVLCALARTPDSLVTKNALLDLVWGHRFVTDSVLKTAVSEVRAALGDDTKQPLRLLPGEDLEQKTPENREHEEVQHADHDVEKFHHEHVVRIRAQRKANGGKG